MKIRLIISIFFVYAGMCGAQEKNTVILPSDGVITNYLAEAKAYAALYSGKTEMPYEVTFTNHPYLETDSYVSGTLCYNHVVYQGVLMRFDLFRDEITVIAPDVPYRIVLNNEKFDYAVLNGSTIIKSVDAKGSAKFLVLLHSGTFPVVKKHTLRIIEETSDRILKRSFQIQNQYAIYVDGTLYPVKNKNAVLKLFPDRKKELNEYAKLYKLNFREQIVQSIIALVNHYENITK
jgi:hypothetical protein